MNSSISHLRPARIERQPLHEIVAGRIRDMIIEGALAQGDEVGEGNLCDLLGVSRTPVREALRTLAGEGLIVLRPGRSMIVRRFTPDEMHDMLAVLAELEAMAARLVCTTASDAEIAGIVAIHDEMMEHFRRGERLVYFKLNQQVHSQIVHASGNGTLVEVHDLLQARMRRARYTGNSSPEKWEAAAAEHEAMIRALLARDAEAAARAMRAHLDNTWLRIENGPGDAPDPAREGSA